MRSIETGNRKQEKEENNDITKYKNEKKNQSKNGEIKTV